METSAGCLVISKHLPSRRDIISNYDDEEDQFDSINIQKALHKALDEREANMGQDKGAQEAQN